MKYIIGSRKGENFSFANSPHIHKSLDAATAERDRLALSTVGKTFVVCQLISEATAGGIAVTNYTEDSNIESLKREILQAYYISKVEAIKLFRIRTGVGLLSAKFAVEVLLNGYSNINAGSVEPYVLKLLNL